MKYVDEFRDGELARKGAVLLHLNGKARAILTGERTALNFLGRLSGIATLVHHFVEKIEGTRAKIRDTRKTTPGLRLLEKYAVKTGGGSNHRIGLYDAQTDQTYELAKEIEDNQRVVAELEEFAKDTAWISHQEQPAGRKA